MITFLPFLPHSAWSTPFNHIFRILSTRFEAPFAKPYPFFPSAYGGIPASPCKVLLCLFTHVIYIFNLN